MALSRLQTLLAENPIAALLEAGSLAVCVGLFLATLFALATGLPTGLGGVWFGIVVVGGAFVVFWTCLVPLYERYFF